MIELDVPVSPTPPVPPHWQAVPLPDADLHRFDERGLRGLGARHALAATPALLAALATAGDGALVFARAGEETWRLQRCDAGLCRVQALADSRQRIFTQWRAHLAARLSAQILHELRNPMNALSLHADLLGRLIGGPQPERGAASLQVIRERINELGARQNALVALWLATAADEPAVELPRRVEENLRMMRGHFALQEIHARVSGLERLGRCRPPRRGAPLELALIGLLLLAADAVVATRVDEGSAELRIETVDVDEAHCALRLHAPLAAAEPAPGLDWDRRGATVADVLAEIALLLDGTPLAPAFAEDGVELRFARA